MLFGAILTWRFRNSQLSGKQPRSIWLLSAILFTSGLDGGFILLPLIEFPQYQEKNIYSFTNPLAIELGFWGITAWTLYYVSTLYFLTLEPKLQLFSKQWVQKLSALVVIITCAFTLSLFTQLVPFYLSERHSDHPLFTFIILLVIILTALVISTRISLMMRISQLSVLIFIGLWSYLALSSQFDSQTLISSIDLGADYLTSLHKFIVPFNDYHEFYLAWWLTWSIMLGQFVARFVSGLKPLPLFIVMTLLPLIPCFLWFALLFHLEQSHFTLTTEVKWCLLLLALAFVINSLDFMVENYSRAFNIGLQDIGKSRFIIINSLLLLTLSYLFQLQLIFVQWSAFVVILLFYLLIGYKKLPTPYFTRSTKKPVANADRCTHTSNIGDQTTTDGMS
ncbi:choline transporter [Thalassotalea insulae]|uniref:Choline transporter n=1 Tax=Thalassotalea insulae TaxID=2056778 RepID=A0ABQ6GQ26_9GAMM|nr:choline transporter [Thalassotalea insulae]